MIKRELTAFLYSNKNIDLMCRLNKSCHKLSMNMVTCINFVELTIKVHKLKPQVIFVDLETIDFNSHRLQLALESKEFKNIKIIVIGTEAQRAYIEALGYSQVGFTTIAQVENYVLSCKEVIDINILNTLNNQEQQDDMKNTVSNLLFELGFSPKHSGFSYLKDIINNILQNGGVVSSLVNEQYPYIAVKFKTSPSNIERNIRNAISLAYKTYNHKNWGEIFPSNSIYKDMKRPSNREFICMCVEALLKTKQSFSANG